MDNKEDKCVSCQESRHDKCIGDGYFCSCSHTAEDTDKDDKVRPIRPGIGQLKPLPGWQDECPPHDPFPVNMELATQLPGSLVPTHVVLQFCQKCHLVYWWERK